MKEKLWKILNFSDYKFINRTEVTASIMNVLKFVNISDINSFLVPKNKEQQAQPDSLVTSPMSEKQDLLPNITAVSTSPRNIILNQSIWNFLVSSSEVINLPSRPLPSPKIYEVICFLVPAPFCLEKFPILYSTLEPLSVCKMECFPIHESLNNDWLFLSSKEY